jgi:hypothetical protein
LLRKLTPWGENLKQTGKTVTGACELLALSPLLP